MARKVNYKIYMNGVYIETVRGLENAEALVRLYQKQDRYEVEVEGYKIPENGYPVYEIR